MRSFVSKADISMIITKEKLVMGNNKCSNFYSIDSSDHHKYDDFPRTSKTLE